MTMMMSMADDDDVADDDVNDQMTYLLSVTVSFVST